MTETWNCDGCGTHRKRLGSGDYCRDCVKRFSAARRYNRRQEQFETELLTKQIDTRDYEDAMRAEEIMEGLK